MLSRQLAGGDSLSSFDFFSQQLRHDVALRAVPAWYATPERSPGLQEALLRGGRRRSDAPNIEELVANFYD